MQVRVILAVGFFCGLISQAAQSQLVDQVALDICFRRPASINDLEQTFGDAPIRICFSGIKVYTPKKPDYFSAELIGRILLTVRVEDRHGVQQTRQLDFTFSEYPVAASKVLNAAHFFYRGGVSKVVGSMRNYDGDVEDCFAQNLLEGYVIFTLDQKTYRIDRQSMRVVFRQLQSGNSCTDLNNQQEFMYTAF